MVRAVASKVSVYSWIPSLSWCFSSPWVKVLRKIRRPADLQFLVSAYSDIKQSNLCCVAWDDTRLWWAQSGSKSLLMRQKISSCESCCIEPSDLIGKLSHKSDNVPRNALQPWWQEPSLLAKTHESIIKSWSCSISVILLRLSWSAKYVSWRSHQTWL